MSSITSLALGTVQCCYQQCIKYHELRSDNTEMACYLWLKHRYIFLSGISPVCLMACTLYQKQTRPRQSKRSSRQRWVIFA